MLVAGVPMTTPFEALKGVSLKSLTPGCLIDVETKSRHYQIECLGGDTIRISGHPDHCPRPVSAQLKGSINEHGVLERGLIERGMRIIFRLNEHLSITTSTVVSVHVDQPKGVQPYSEGLMSGSYPIPY
jgi:hypothetical protein